MKITAIVLMLVIAAACSGRSGKNQETAAGQAPAPAAGEGDESGGLPGWMRGVETGDRYGKKPEDAGTAPDAPSTSGAIGVIGAVAAVPTAPAVAGTEKWKQTIGYTTYRSTIHLFDGKIVVNSNGADWKSTSDAQDGVYVLDPATGNVIDQLVPPAGGEMDCNGVALTKDALFFGTDQDMFYRMDWSGKVKWKVPVSGDVESAPALADLNGDKVLDAVFGAEAGVFYAVDGKKGKVLWTVKASAGYYGATGFLGAPALFDATGDGIEDVFVPCRDELFRALDGKTGKTVWQQKGSSAMHGAPVIVDADGDGKKEVVFTEAYSDVWCADAATGTIKWKTTLTNPNGGIEGLFSPVGWYPDAGCALVATAWWQSGEGVYCLSGKTGGILWRYAEASKNISSGAVIGDVDGKTGAEAVFGTESGKIVAVDTAGQAVLSHIVGGPVECTPTLADVDGDGDTEIIAAANNGSIYLIETPGKAPPVIPYHRGTPQNNGNL